MKIDHKKTDVNLFLGLLEFAMIGIRIGNADHLFWAPHSAHLQRDFAFGWKAGFFGLFRDYRSV